MKRETEGTKRVGQGKNRYTWRKGEVAVSIKDENGGDSDIEVVPAVLCDGDLLAVHKTRVKYPSLPSSTYTITHTLSGLKFPCTFTSESAAKACAEKILTLSEELCVDWGEANPVCFMGDYEKEEIINLLREGGHLDPPTLGRREVGSTKSKR